MRFNRLFFLPITLGLFFISCKDPKIEKIDVRKKSDVLLIMYVSCDANNGNNFFPSLQQAENALKKIRNEDGTPKEGFSSVNVVALYDGGVTTDINTNSDQNTRLLELGMAVEDYDEETLTGLYDSKRKNTWLLSSNTKDLSSTVNWIYNNGRQEVNMGSYITLKNFLSWVHNHYKADTTILTFCDHGAGIVAETEIDTAYEARMVVFDDDKNGDDNQGLSTAGVVYALSETGYKGSEKMDLIIEDLCLDCCIENIYGLKGYTKLYMGSPEMTYGNSLGYYYFLQRFRKDVNLIQICKDEISLDSTHSYAIKFPNIFENIEGAFNDKIFSCMTLVDMTKENELEDIKKCIADFSAIVAQNKTKYAGVISDLQNKSNGYTYGGTFYAVKDIGSFMKNYKDNSSYPELQNSAKKICDDLSIIILHAHQVTRYSTGKEGQTVSVNSIDNKNNIIGSANYTYANENYYGIPIAFKSISSFTVHGKNIEYKDSNTFTKGSLWYQLMESDE